LIKLLLVACSNTHFGKRGSCPRAHLPSSSSFSTPGVPSPCGIHSYTKCFSFIYHADH
jgi:hypothetical protein